MEGDEGRSAKKGNTLPVWGNEKTMNLNSMVLTNIQSSPYFKNTLYQLKTYHEVVDEIYYKVEHLEPWEKGSRKTSGQVGMCGGVRGVGAGGIVSTAYCLLYKLYTLKLTRKQLNGLITHVDSPFIRGLGFMYIRYTIPPPDLWSWYVDYLEDEEEFDPKAGGGSNMTVGQLVRSFLLKLEWYGTLFPRIPVPVQKDIERRLRELGLCDDHKRTAQDSWGEAEDFSRRGRGDSSSRDSARNSREMNEEPRSRNGSADRSSRSRRSRSRSRDRSERRRSRSRDRSERRRSRSRDRSEKRRSRSGDRSERRRSRSRDRSERRRSRSRDRSERRKRSRSRSRERRDGDREKRHGKHRSRSPKRRSKERDSSSRREKSRSR